MQNDRSFTGFRGNKVFIKVIGYTIKDQKDVSNDIAGRNLIIEVKEWLNLNNKYVSVENEELSNITIILGVFSEDKIIHIPSQTYTSPVYGNSNGSTTTVKNIYGQTLGTLETNSNNIYGPTGYTTNYVEGYNTQVSDRSLVLTIVSNESGKIGKVVSEGGAIPKNYSKEFFEDRRMIKSAIEELLNNTVLAK